MFNRFYLGILLSILVVLGSLLGLQLLLNNLKYQSLVTSAVAQRMQITASTLENSISKAEQLGLSIDEMDGLDMLIERELSKSEIIENIIIISPSSKVFFDSSNDDSSFKKIKENLLNRIVTKEKPIFSTEINNKLYTSRKLFDSTSNVMAIIILTTDNSNYTAAVKRVNNKMTTDFLWVFIIFSILLIPVVILGFSKISKLIEVIEYELFDKNDFLSNKSAPAGLEDADNDQLRDALLKGQKAFESAEQELDILVGKAYGEQK